MAYVFKNTDLMTIYDAMTGGSGSNTLLQKIYDAIDNGNPNLAKGTNLYITEVISKLTSTSLGTSVANSLQAEIGGVDYFLLETQVSSGKTTAFWSELIRGDTSTTATNTGTISSNTGAIRTPVLTSTTGNLTIAPQVHNLSVYNSGAANGTINVNGGGNITIPAGVTVNFDAGGNNNRYPASAFVLNATGTTFIVSYTQ